MSFKESFSSFTLTERRKENLLSENILGAVIEGCYACAKPEAFYKKNFSTVKTVKGGKRHEKVPSEVQGLESGQARKK